MHKVWCSYYTIVDFYIYDFIFALFIFMKEGKTVNCNGTFCSEINGLINLKYMKRMACPDIFCTVQAGFSWGGKRSTNRVECQPVQNTKMILAAFHWLERPRSILVFMERYDPTLLNNIKNQSVSAMKLKKSLKYKEHMWTALSPEYQYF